MTSLPTALLALAVAAAGLAAPAAAQVAPTAPTAATTAASTAPSADARGCARGSAPYDVGTATIRVRSGGSRLSTTVAYPATSAGAGATRVCRKSPLVVVGHGSQGDGASAARLHSYLVERGYVVAAPSLDASGYDFGGMAHDISRTITKARRTEWVRSSGKVGYIGTSMGGIIGLTLADRGHRDRRIGAIVSKAGTAYGSLDARKAPPVLMINGDADTTITYASARAAYGELTKPKGLIRLAGVGHDLNTGGDPILATASGLFLDRYLRGRDKALGKIAREAQSSKIASLRKRW